MKINAKINGINHQLRAPPYDWMKQPYIVIGEKGDRFKFCEIAHLEVQS